MCILAAARGGRSPRLVAFVAAFEWMRGASEAVVLFDSRRACDRSHGLAAFKIAVEARIREGTLLSTDGFLGYRLLANA
jgi:hypothetical protein